jgi:hypothetical protein
MSRDTNTKAQVLSDVCSLLGADQKLEASALLQERYPYSKASNAGRKWTTVEALRVFARDGFIDRYSGLRLLFPGTLRIISLDMPNEFPYQSHGKTDECHFGFWELFPTIDHVDPVSRNGLDDANNWVTTTMAKNCSKANFTLDELGWKLLPISKDSNWDGLMSWFSNEVARRPGLLANAYVRKWDKAIKTLGTVQGSKE